MAWSDAARAAALEVRRRNLGIKIERPVNGTYVIRHNGREIGRANLSDSGAYLTSVRIDKEFQRRGIGRVLYAHIEHDIRRQLIPSPTYQTPSAKAFWVKRYAAMGRLRRMRK